MLIMVQWTDQMSQQTNGVSPACRTPHICVVSSMHDISLTGGINECCSETPIPFKPHLLCILCTVNLLEKEDFSLIVVATTATKTAQQQQ